MANELKHKTVGTAMTQTEFEDILLHQLDAQATGDLVYASSAAQLSRLGIGTVDQVLKIISGLPSWQPQHYYPQGDTSCQLYIPCYDWDLRDSPFDSKDKNAHVSTVTGAIWGAQGRTFDGTDDKIITTSTASLIPIYSALAWIKIDTNADPLTLLSFGNSAAPDELTSRGLRIRFCNGVYGSAWSSPSTLRTAGVWYHVALVRDNTANWVKIYVNGVIDTDEAYAWDLTEDPVEFQIGCFNENATPAEFFDGTIGEVLVYNRALTATEILSNYLATKWRYS